MSVNTSRNACTCLRSVTTDS